MAWTTAGQPEEEGFVRGMLSAVLQSVTVAGRPGTRRHPGLQQWKHKAVHYLAVVVRKQLLQEVEPA